LKAAGYDANLAAAGDDGDDPEMTRLLRATAVAGFAAMNIMVLSVAVWSGADQQTRAEFHILSALIAIPVVFYSGSVFFAGALRSLRARQMGMDLPISVGILLALALSLYDTATGGPYAYFDAVTSLMFVLLAGRTLDHAMRKKARSAVSSLAAMMPRGATVVDANGERSYRQLSDIKAGDVVLLAAGDRVPLDGTVISGAGMLDVSIVTGESAPVRAEPGTELAAGTLNLDGALTLRATKPANESFLADMVRLIEGAELGRAGYRRITDRAAALYSPIVHILAFAAGVFWLAANGDLHHAVTVAVCVLIITCPCALGLAVPMVQVVAAGRLFRLGIALKDGSALERLAAVDCVVFDKTGTLTAGESRVVTVSVPAGEMPAAVALAGRSRHAMARAIADIPALQVASISNVTEVAGFGIEGAVDGSKYMLGRRDWVSEMPGLETDCDATVWLSKNGSVVGAFAITDELRPDAVVAVRELRAVGLDIEVLSGDAEVNVAAVAKSLGIARFASRVLPQEKLARLRELEAQDHRTLMVGDGINDAPALSGAYVSIAPASAVDVGRNAAEMVCFNARLDAIPLAVEIARFADRLVKQNLALATFYNAAFVPVALAGYVTPLMAAIAMSTSSILVVGNALRLSFVPCERAGWAPLRTSLEAA
jgi:Cu2+-exporting ATPase